METIDIEQVLYKAGDASYRVEISVNGDVPEIHEFTKTNGVYPLYQTLISAIKQFEGVTVNLSTEPRFAREVQGVPNQNTRLLEILKNVQAQREILINVVKDERE